MVAHREIYGKENRNLFNRALPIKLLPRSLNHLNIAMLREAVTITVFAVFHDPSLSNHVDNITIYLRFLYHTGYAFTNLKSLLVLYCQLT